MQYNCSITPPDIQKLLPHEIFVFGSNLAGIHGAGAARTAYEKFGARMGKGTGRYGNSYALPTKGYNIATLSLNKIAFYIDALHYDITVNPELTFLITEIGCGLAGYTPKDIAPLFKDFIQLNNCALPKSFIDIITE